MLNTWINVYTTCFLILYMDNIFLITNNKWMKYEVKQLVSKNFDTKDMGIASYFIDIKIYRDRS